MKDKILKIAGVKTEKQFYAKYPSEEAFMKVHGKAFKKAQIGAVISGGVQTATPKPIDFNSVYDQADMTATGQTNKMRQDDAYKQANLAAQQKQANNSGGGDGLAGLVGQIGKMAGAAGTAKKGAKLPKYQNAPTPIQPINSQATSSSTYGLAATQQYVPTTQQIAEGKQYGQNQQNQATAGIMGTIKKAAGPAGDIIGGIEALKAEKEQLAQSKQQLAVSDLSRQVSELKPEQTQRKYARPEDIQNTGEEFFPIYGVGTNVLARNGAMLQDGGPIGGNPTEIQNTYGIGNSIYDDLGYEPLSDSEIVKQYRAGGLVQAQNGFTNFMGAGGTDMATQAAGSISGNNAGSQIGKGVGNSLKMIPGVGPVVGAVAAPILSAIGGALDTTAHGIEKNQAATQRNITTSALNQGVKGIQAQNTSFMEDGGWMNPEYNPQVIAKFGDHSPEDIYHFAHQGMDSLRAGGHLKSYTAPSEEAMQTYAMGGELQTHWGGGAETISQNPYLPDGGETVMFRGNSHEERSPNGETGIGVTYGNNPVEVERGEPAVKLQDGTGGDNSLVVYGNLQIPKYGVDMLDDPKAKGKKFKNYVADLSKNEAQQNRTINTSINKLDELDVRTPIDQLQLSALQANLMGGNMHLKNIAEKKQNAAQLQQALNDTAQEHGIVADDLARGKITIDKEAMKQYAKFGGKFESAQDGTNKTNNSVDRTNYNYLVGLYDEAQKQQRGPAVEKFQREFSRIDPEKARSVLSQSPVTNYGKSQGMTTPSLESNYDQIFGPRTEAYRNSLEAPAADQLMQPRSGLLLINGKPLPNELMPMNNYTPTTPKKDNNWWMNYADQALQYLRPTPKVEQPDLTPEMMAMSMNQLEPVKAQGYQPDLRVPYDVSFQDRLNANQGDYRATQKLLAGNPEALAVLNAQKYGANSQVLADQFRANQAMKDQVYSGNIQALNEAKLKNLGIYDQQYVRQTQAKSNTKAQAFEIAKSISDKIAKQKQEQKRSDLKSQEYNYRFDSKGRPIYMGPLSRFNTSGAPGTSNRGTQDIPEEWMKLYDEKGSFQGTKKRPKDDKEDDTTTKKNGGKIKSRNGSIVNAIKNL
jgi:uncharacterized protein (DUF697 family)